MPDDPARRNPDDVARCLAGTGLAGAPLIEVPLPEAPDVTWVIDLGGGDLAAAWREARDAVAGLGLYPVAVTTWGLSDWPAADLFSRFYHGGGADVAPWSVITRSSALSVEEALLQLMREWQGRFGAQLVASWGTMLQFAVSAPPETLDEAFDLAAQHAAVAPCTTMLPGEGIRQLARHLWRGERWFLHERP
jgi:hypothetical protein